MTYTNPTDCANKIRWLLANPLEAEKIRAAGRARAIRDHTWQKRFEELFNFIGLSG
jgi:spore maturation protein CgeB